MNALHESSDQSKRTTLSPPVTSPPLPVDLPN